MSLAMCVMILIALIMMMVEDGGEEIRRRSTLPEGVNPRGYKRGDIIKNVSWHAWETIQEVKPLDLLQYLRQGLTFDGDVTYMKAVFDPNKYGEHVFIELGPENRISLAELIRNPTSWPDNVGFIQTDTEYHRGVINEGAKAIYCCDGALWLIREQEIDGIGSILPILYIREQVERRAFMETLGTFSFQEIHKAIQTAADEQGIAIPLLVVFVFPPASGQLVVVKNQEEWEAVLGGGPYQQVWGLDGSKYKVG